MRSYKLTLIVRIVVCDSVLFICLEGTRLKWTIPAANMYGNC